MSDFKYYQKLTDDTFVEVGGDAVGNYDTLYEAILSPVIAMAIFVYRLIILGIDLVLIFSLGQLIARVFDL